jgi:hypothetical protein
MDNVVQIRLAQIGLDIEVLLPPPVPRLYPLPEQIKMFLICHTIRLLAPQLLAFYHQTCL